MRPNYGWPITLAVVMIAMVVTLIVGWIILTARETVEGHVLREARGSNGFGYDPLFFIDHLGKTTAELLSEETHAISHRGKALRVMTKLLKEM